MIQFLSRDPEGELAGWTECGSSLGIATVAPGAPARTVLPQVYP